MYISPRGGSVWLFILCLYISLFSSKKRARNSINELEEMHEKGKYIVKHSHIYTPTMESNVVFFVAIDCIHSYKYHQVSIVNRPKQTDRQTERQTNKLSSFDDFF